MRKAAHRPDVVWLTPRAQRERIADGTADHALQLSRAQKWDLVRICLAALASAAFFSAPFLLSNDSAAAPGNNVTTPSVPVEHAARVQQALDRISVVTTDVSVPVTTAVLVRSVQLRSARPASRPSHLRASVEARGTSPAESPGLARRLGRAIAGDGRYTVRPFPTLDANH